MPPHGPISSGSNVNVPLDVTFTPLQPSSHPSYHFSYTFRLWQPWPMGVYGLPYSLSTHVLGSFANGALGQASVEACRNPRLCPGSWARTTHPVEPLIHVLRAGRFTDPSSASPVNRQLATLVRK